MFILNMLRALLIVSIGTLNLVLAQEANQSSLCTLPPYPKNGRYVVDNKPQVGPGSAVKDFVLRQSCNSGFQGLGESTIACSEGFFIQPKTAFQCLPTCERSQSVLSCGAGSRCLLEPGRGNFDRALGWTNFQECGQTGNIRSQRHVVPWYWTMVHYIPFIPDEEHMIPDKEIHVPDKDRDAIDVENNVSKKNNISTTVPFVSGGRSALRGEFPWHAGIYSKRTSPFMQICGGTLVSNNVVISAAHCFWSPELERQLPATDYAVAVGKLYRPFNEKNDTLAQNSDVREVRIPPYFQGDTTNLQEDIALLILASSFTFTAEVRPICLDFDLELAQKHVQAERRGYVAGWGLTNATSTVESPVLKKAELPVIDLQRCFQQTSPQFRAYITADKFCAGWNNGTAVCKGDSGGGFFVSEMSPNSGFRYYLRGIVSGAPAVNEACNVFTWATFTHVQKHEQFILQTLQETSAASNREEVRSGNVIQFPDSKK